MVRARADMSSSPWPPAMRPTSNCAASAETGSDGADPLGEVERDGEILVVQRRP